MPYLEHDSATIRRGIAVGSEVSIGPSKHAGNAIAGASPLLEKVRIINPPPIKDFSNFLGIYDALGASIEREDAALLLKSGSLRRASIPEDLAKETRASLLLLSGALLRLGWIKMPMPEGDWPGTRRTSSEIETVRQFGAEVTVENGYITAKFPHPQKKRLEIEADNKVLTTLIALIMASGTGGEYKIHNPLSSIEVDNLAKLLQSIGAQIEGLDTNTITVQSEGMGHLKTAVDVVIAPDVCETLFWLAYANLHQKAITCTFPYWDNQISEEQFGPLFDVKQFLQQTNMKIQVIGRNKFTILPQDTKHIKSVDVVPPYEDKRGRPRDAMPQIAVLFGVLHAQKSLYYDDKYTRRRVAWMQELNKIGGDIQFLTSDTALITGNNKGYYHTQDDTVQLTADDIRSVASLLLAASTCEKPVTVQRLSHIDRSYTHLLSKMNLLGTDIVDISQH